MFKTCRPMKSSLSKRKGSKAFAKMVVNSANGKVLGVHFAGAEAAEIVQVHFTSLLCTVERWRVVEIPRWYCKPLMESQQSACSASKHEFSRGCRGKTFDGRIEG